MEMTAPTTAYIAIAVAAALAAQVFVNYNRQQAPTRQSTTVVEEEEAQLSDENFYKRVANLGSPRVVHGSLGKIGCCPPSKRARTPVYKPPIVDELCRPPSPQHQLTHTHSYLNNPFSQGTYWPAYTVWTLEYIVERLPWVLAYQSTDRRFTTFHDNKPLEGLLNSKKWEQYNTEHNCTTSTVLRHRQPDLQSAPSHSNEDYHYYFSSDVTLLSER